MRRILGFVLLIAFLTLPVAVLMAPQLKEPQFIGNNAEFVGQDAAEVGELVRFLAEGEIVRWTCLPTTADCESYGEFNENFVISFRQPGIYTIVAAIYTQEDLDIVSQEVVVGTPPLPIAVDPIVPLEIDELLVNRVEGWVLKYEVEREVRIEMSSVFTTVAESIKNGDLTTPDQIIRRTASLNSNLRVDPNLIAELQAYLMSQSDSGALQTIDQHIIVWSSIARGLKNGPN